MYVRELFMGMRPRMGEFMLRPGEAAVAYDCDFRSGELRGLADNEHLQVMKDENQFVIPCGYSGDKPRFHQVTDRTDWIVDGPRTLFLAGGKLKYVKHVDNPVEYDKRLPKPKSNLTLPPQDSGDDQSSWTTYTFAYSLVNTVTGDESGLFINPEEVNNRQISPTRTGYNVTAPSQSALLGMGRHDTANIEIRLYISSTGTFHSLGDRPLAGTRTWTLDFNKLQLGKEHPWPVDNVSLPDGIEGMVSHPNGFMAAFSGNEVMFNDPLNVGMWPPSYRYRMEADVIAMAEHQNRLLCFFQGRRHQVFEAASPTQASIQSPENAPPCMSRGSVCKIDHGIVYASTDGPVITDGYQSQYLLPQHFDRRSFDLYFSNLGETRIFGDRNDLFICPGPGSDTVYIQDNNQMTLLTDKIVDGLYHDGQVFLVVRPNPASKPELLKAFAKPQEPRRYTWKSDPKEGPVPQLMNHCRLLAKYASDRESSLGGLGTGQLARDTKTAALFGSFTLTERVNRDVDLTILADEFVHQPITFTESIGDQVVSIPTSGQAKRWQIQLEGEIPVQSVALGSYAETTYRPTPGGMAR